MSYKKDLHHLQVELAKLCNMVKEKGLRLAFIFEGRDTAGKDGVIKRILEHLPPRHASMVALDKPTDKERRSWYFQRYVPHLPACGEIKLFNRSWYNRAGVEPVMGFCTPEEYEVFMRQVALFERMIAEKELVLVKYWLDITKKEQKKRLEARKEDALKRWKLSPLDAEAQKRWGEYSKHRDAMLKRTHHDKVPWILIDANDKKLARLNVLRDIVSRFDYPHKKSVHPDSHIVQSFHYDILEGDFLAP